MSKFQNRKEGSHAYRLPPCPSFDIEGMESWLADMAGKGLLLEKDGFFAGIAAFQYTKPQALAYRLDAAPKSTSMWSGDNGEPEPEAVALSEKYGWEYVASRGGFYIYRSSEPRARELNTDPKVQALALNAVRKRQRSALFCCFFWMILYPVLQFHGDLFLTMINSGTWFFLLGTTLLLWLFLDSLSESLRLGRLRKKLLEGYVLDHNKDWKKHTARHYGKAGLQLVLILFWLCTLMHHWNASVLDEDKISLADYHGNPPFATMADFAGRAEARYQMNFPDIRFNSIREWTDWLAPYNAEWAEHAAITLADGKVIDGGLYVDYHETVNLWIAKRLAWEYYRKDKRGKWFSPLETPALDAELDVDFAIAYNNNIGFPTIVIQNGTTVIRATFFQTSANYQIPLEEWGRIMADSIR